MQLNPSLPDAPITDTRDPRIKIGNYGRGNWRTVVRDDDGTWGITGPPYATKLEALSTISDVLRYYFGES